MKYMGGKSNLLEGKLGDILLEEINGARRFVDLFAGSGAVTHFIAQRVDVPVLSIDLQLYSRVLSAAVIERTESLEDNFILDSWLSGVSRSVETGSRGPLTENTVLEARREANSAENGFIERHYGGYYYSLRQARALDLLYNKLPEHDPFRTVALAALIHAASVCAASPGHTAQPFRPTGQLLPYIEYAWSRDVVSVTRTAIERLAPVHARVKGHAILGDALSTADCLNENDVVFCDPPYSAVQYSRFYHVLEGIARGGWDKIQGNGRAPERSIRSSSDFSMKSKAQGAMRNMLDTLRKRNCRVVITFPNECASNGLSGSAIMSMASESWNVTAHYVESKHSTLGGANDGGRRGGRRVVEEAVIVLHPIRS